MGLKSRFLSLSIKEQICIAIFLLNIFSLMVVLFLACSFCYEILKEDYNQKKLYFYDKYKEFIESTFFFQNFCLLQYEEMIKRFQKQIYKFHRNSTTTYNFTSNFDNSEKDYVPYFDINIHKNISQDNDLLFFFCYNQNKTLCQYLKNVANSYYVPISNLIFSHDIDKYFRIPGYNIPILKSPIIVDVNSSLMFSFNGTKIYENIMFDKLYDYFRDVTSLMMNNAFNMFKYFFTDILFLFRNTFEKASKEMENLEEISIVNINNNDTFFEYVRAVSGYYSSVKFTSNQFSLISYNFDKYFYFEGNMIDNFLYFIHNRLTDFLDFSFIPLHYENNTIISPELCIQFLLKQINYQIDKEKIRELYKSIKIGESNITDCFFNNKIIEKIYEINDVFITNCSHFLTVDNLLYEGIIEGGEYPFYYMKYTYPNFNILKEFQSEYLLLDQINFYLFASFKDPIIFSEYVFKTYKNLFFMIVMIIIYTWIICLIINLFIYFNIITQIIEPITNLQKAIESSSTKDEKIFKYKYDAFINDLFLTCKELLSGQIDSNNNEKGLGQFNILSFPKEKKIIDKNIYQRNLIINNDIMNQLINEQQNMMDFSKNIKINDIMDKNYNNNDNKNNFQNIKKININIINDNFALSKNDNNTKENLSNKQNELKNNIKQNKINEIRDREPYKKLLQIAEYLYYYQNKVEKNYIHLVNNIITDESKRSNLSKISSNINFNGSLKITSKLKKIISKVDSYGKTEDMEKLSINMLDNKNISYFWYMEAKKKMNKSINYQIDNDFNELFDGCNNSQSNHENIKKNIK